MAWILYFKMAGAKAAHEGAMNSFHCKIEGFLTEIHDKVTGKGDNTVDNTRAAMMAALSVEIDVIPVAKPLRGLEIPLFARIVAVADVYDALTSKRAYKDPWPAEKVTELLRSESGRAFDPELVDIALELEGYFRSVRARFAGSGH